MKNRLIKTALFGASIIVAASASHGLISSHNLESLHGLEPLKPLENAPLAPTQVSLGEEIEHIIKRGENLSAIFDSLNLSKEDLHKIVHTNAIGQQFAEVEPGQSIVATVSADGKLEQLSYNKNPFEVIRATRDAEGFDVKLLSKQVDHEIASTQGTIHSSLFEDGIQAGLSEKTILKLADIFAWDIDFAQNLQDGDQFTVVYEKLSVDGQPFDIGDILSVEFINQGKTYAAVRFEDDHGLISYYTPEGHSLRKAFLQTPMDFAKISSHFNLHRKHPILNTIRAHKGVDYVAAVGTPVKTTGDGKIAFRGDRNGYGNVVEIQHGSQYSTLYAHLSGFKKGLKNGSLVKQGEVIGYVGKTGLATGPHLHYEFRINGAHVNPLSAKLPRSLPMDKSMLSKFKAQTKPLLAQLNRAKAGELVAQNES